MAAESSLHAGAVSRSSPSSSLRPTGNDPRCSEPECTNGPRSPGSKLCAKHYHRQYRHGNTERTARGNRAFVRRYRSVYDPDHPLAGKNGKTYHHRAVLYASLGPGIHPCAWCGVLLVWRADGEHQLLEADHVNHDSHDDRPENLVASCRRCNVSRGQAHRHERLVEAGWWSNNDTIAKLAVGRR